jgi:hypothetical protein
VGLSSLTSAYELPQPFGSEARLVLTQGAIGSTEVANLTRSRQATFLSDRRYQQVQSFGRDLARATRRRSE